MATDTQPVPHPYSPAGAPPAPKPKPGSMGPPANYDNGQTLRIDSVGMYGAGFRNIPNYLSNIADCWSTIDKAWRSVHLSWVGDTADEAQAFNDKLQKIQDRLFGAKILPLLGDVPGVIGRLGIIAATAGANYGSADSTIRKMFQDFYDAVDVAQLPPEGSDSDTPDGTYTGPPLEVHNVTDPPVTETYAHPKDLGLHKSI